MQEPEFRRSPALWNTKLPRRGDLVLFAGEKYRVWDIEKVCLLLSNYLLIEQHYWPRWLDDLDGSRSYELLIDPRDSRFCTRAHYDDPITVLERWKDIKAEAVAVRTLWDRMRPQVEEFRRAQEARRELERRLTTGRLTVNEFRRILNPDLIVDPTNTTININGDYATVIIN